MPHFFYNSMVRAASCVLYAGKRIYASTTCMILHVSSLCIAFLLFSKSSFFGVRLLGWREFLEMSLSDCSSVKNEESSNGPRRSFTSAFNRSLLCTQSFPTSTIILWFRICSAHSQSESKKSLQRHETEKRRCLGVWIFCNKKPYSESAYWPLLGRLICMALLLNMLRRRLRHIYVRWVHCRVMGVNHSCFPRRVFFRD